jgi:hypothetical protein
MSPTNAQNALWSRAPLYVRVLDLARWLNTRSEDRAAVPYAGLAQRTALESEELLVAVSLALTFPARRSQSLERADEAVVRIRLLMRLACELGGMSAAQLGYASSELDGIGRMIGGWRRSRRRRTSRANPAGVEAPRATGGSCVAGRSGTTPTGAAPRTATRGTRGTATTTSGSASPSPPEGL